MEYPITKGTINNTSIVVYEYRYKDIAVPEGYETNGADIPRLFWSWTPPLNLSIYLLY